MALPCNKTLPGVTPIVALFAIIFFNLTLITVCSGLNTFEFSVNDEHNFLEKGYDTVVDEGNFRKASKGRIRRGVDPGSSVNMAEMCKRQQKDHLQDLNSMKLESEHSFNNETNWSLSLAWASEDGDKIIVVTTKEQQFFSMFMTSPSTIYRSIDGGKSFENITSKVSKSERVYIRKNNGIMRNDKSPERVYLIGHNLHKQDTSILYSTDDSGENFLESKLDFYVKRDIIVNPFKPEQLLTLSQDQGLWLSTNNGYKWTNLLKKVESFQWSHYEDEKDAIYATSADSILGGIQTYKLMKKSCIAVKPNCDWKNILNEPIHSFKGAEKFLYATVIINSFSFNIQRVLKVSTDAGVSWTAAQLPRLKPGTFFSVLDMSEGIVFVHVDEVGDTGYGTLYTSGRDGIVYSVSLERHLYPNYIEVTDFYKVQSMNGVYITSQLSKDNSTHTLITFNRGATWQPIDRPDKVPCHDEKKACNLQIHNTYSKARRLPIEVPLSSKNAPGIILVHGHVGDGLQTTPPDVFISRNGGYTFSKIFDGPHMYKIADHGGLLVAVKKDDEQNRILKFSTDEGNCWHEYTYTNESIRLTGLLVEPEGKTLKVSIWGYSIGSKTWKVFFIDFKKLITEECVSSDYVTWRPHDLLEKEHKGCMLGEVMEIERLRTDSWCYNGQYYHRTTDKRSCACTRDDYECDYGYERKLDSDECVESKALKKDELDICLRGHEEKIVTEGYRKIPGDKCEGGFQPTGKDIDLNMQCSQDKMVIISKQVKEDSPKDLSKASSVAVIVIALLVGFLCVVLLSYFGIKFIRLRRHREIYSYSSLSDHVQVQTNNEPDNYDTEPTFQDSFDEELNSNLFNKNELSAPGLNHDEAAKVQSYHDDSDDDMLV